MYKPIYINREELTIMDVQFSDLQTLEITASAIGSNMFEGFIPTPEKIRLIRDYVTGKISLIEFAKRVKEK